MLATLIEMSRSRELGGVEKMGGECFGDGVGVKASQPIPDSPEFMLRDSALVEVTVAVQERVKPVRIGRNGQERCLKKREVGPSALRFCLQSDH